MTSFKQLREIAMAATPGPWTVGEDPRECAATLRAAPVIAGQSEPCGPPIDVIIPFGRAYSDARHIAAFSPSVCLALLDRLERAERDVERLTVNAGAPIGTDAPAGHCGADAPAEAAAPAAEAAQEAAAPAQEEAA